MFIIDDLLIGLPAKGLVSIFNKIYKMAEAELTDESKLKEELLRLQTMYEIDQISEEEYQKKETEILERLTAVREAKSDPSTGHSTLRDEPSGSDSKSSGSSLR